MPELNQKADLSSILLPLYRSMSLRELKEQVDYDDFTSKIAEIYSRGKRNGSLRGKSDLASMLDYSEGTIDGLLKHARDDLNMKITPYKMDAERKKQLVRDYKTRKDKSVKEIADGYGISRSYFYNILKQQKVKYRRRKAGVIAKDMDDLVAADQNGADLPSMTDANIGHDYSSWNTGIIKDVIDDLVTAPTLSEGVRKKVRRAKRWISSYLDWKADQAYSRRYAAGFFREKKRSIRAALKREKEQNPYWIFTHPGKKIMKMAAGVAIASTLAYFLFNGRSTTGEAYGEGQMSASDAIRPKPTRTVEAKPKQFASQGKTESAQESPERDAEHSVKKQGLVPGLTGLQGFYEASQELIEELLNSKKLEPWQRVMGPTLEAEQVRFSKENLGQEPGKDGFRSWIE